jgi:non-heme chloroperoxidase
LPTTAAATAALVAAVTPELLQSASNPHGVPLKKYDDNRASSTADRSQFYREIASGSFYGANRPGAKVSQGVMDRFWLQGITAGHHNTYACIKAFSETDFTADLKKFTIPTLIIHGNDDQIVPIAVSALRASDLIDNAILKIYEGAPHGLTDTHKDQLNADLLEFLR